MTDPFDTVPDHDEGSAGTSRNLEASDPFLAAYEEMRRERNEARRALERLGHHGAAEAQGITDDYIAQWKARAEAAERERDELREALRAYMVATDIYEPGHPERVALWQSLHEHVYGVALASGKAKP